MQIFTGWKKLLNDLMHTWIIRIRPWMVILLIVCGYVGTVLVRYKGDPLSFVMVGGHFDPTVDNESLGYDGQFAYQIAVDPFDGWQRVDVPSYRYQRILYPLLARLLSFGNASLIPWMLILINMVVLVGGVAVTEAVLIQSGVNRWYALTYGLFVGLLGSVRLDLTEPLAYFIVQVAFLMLSKKRLWWAAAFFILASLARELTLMFAVAYPIHLLSVRRWKTALTWSGVVFLPFIAWQVILKLWFGHWGIGSGGALSSPFEVIPFHGWWGIISDSPEAFLLLSLYVVPLALLPAVVSMVTSICTLMRRGCGMATWALLINAAVFMILPRSNVLDAFGLARVTAGLMIAVINFGAEQRSLRALRYSLLWATTVIFLVNDSIFPISLDEVFLP